MFLRSLSSVASPAGQSTIHPALRRFGDECGDALIKGLAYVGALALLAAVALYTAKPFVTRLSALGTASPDPSFVAAPRSPPAFAVSRAQFAGTTETYTVLRRPEGGRKDVLRWAAPGEAAIAELEIYRIGAEAAGAVPDPSFLGDDAPQPAGVIDSKFGPLALLARTRANGAPCIEFAKAFEQPRLRLSGWSCQGATLPEQRAAIGCLVDRLVLLGAGGDQALAELFARAELRRGTCQAGPNLAASAGNWVTAPQNPMLRGSL